MTSRLQINRRARRERASLITEIVVAMAIFTVAVIPLTFSFINNQMQVRRLYHKAAAMEIIDGEMEILAAGEWHSFKEGAQPYPLEAKHAKNLPRGAAQLIINGKHLRLEWTPEDRRKGDVVVREGNVR